VRVVGGMERFASAIESLRILSARVPCASLLTACGAGAYIWSPPKARLMAILFLHFVVAPPADRRSFCRSVFVVAPVTNYPGKQKGIRVRESTNRGCILSQMLRSSTRCPEDLTHVTNSSAANPASDPVCAQPRRSPNSSRPSANRFVIHCQTAAHRRRSIADDRGRRKSPQRPRHMPHTRRPRGHVFICTTAWPRA
jgi:hypothetical protein